MSDQLTLLQQLERLLVWKKSKKFMADKLGITESEVNDLLKELKEKDNEPNEALQIAVYEAVRKVNNEKGTIESTVILDFEPKDDIELAKAHKVNLDKYVITLYWSKLQPDGKYTSSLLSRRKTPEDYTVDDFTKFLSTYKPNYVSKPIEVVSKPNLVDVEISISDFHLAKKHIDDKDNSIETRYLRYFHAAQSLVKDVAAIHNIDTLVLPISNDFFHTDNYQNQTTNGTPQDVITDYAHEYEVGFDLLVNTISMLTSYSRKVHVVLVQGNHDRTKSYYLAHGLEVFFKEDPRVSFDREHSIVKGITLGNTFVGYHHGNCKIDELPLLFATHPSYSSDFGFSRYREVHTGDKHHYMAKEIKGVRIQQMPSLSGTDRWHADGLYVHSIRAALALVYDKELGKINEFEFRT